MGFPKSIGLELSINITSLRDFRTDSLGVAGWRHASAVDLRANPWPARLSRFCLCQFTFSATDFLIRSNQLPPSRADVMTSPLEYSRCSQPERFYS